MFYDYLSTCYDEMIPLEKRIEGLKKQLGGIVEKYHPRTALDAGSATGATCIALTQMGVAAMGVESSSSMVKIARRNSASYGLKIPYKNTDLLAKLPAFNSRFESIFILANTISHFLNNRSLSRLLNNFQNWLAPGGVLAIQLLNYSRIYKNQERIVKVVKRGSRTFVRFYDLNRNSVNFNILVIENDCENPDYVFHSIPIRPWTYEKLNVTLRSFGFISIKRHGDLEGSPFNALNSHDLVILCRKQN